jgi:hypothetical protein
MQNSMGKALTRLESELRSQNAAFLRLRRIPRQPPAEIEARIIGIAGIAHPDVVAWFSWQDGADAIGGGVIPPVFGDFLACGLTESIAMGALTSEHFGVTGGNPNPWLVVADNEMTLLLVHAQTGVIHRLWEWTDLTEPDQCLADLIDAWTALMTTNARWSDVSNSWEGRDEAEYRPLLLKRAGY